MVESQDDEDKAAGINAVQGGRQLTGVADIRAAGGMARRWSTGRRRATLLPPPPPAGSATTTGSSATMPTSARVVPQSPATGRVISHQVVVSRVALMRSPQAVSQPCSEPPNGEQHRAASSTAMQNGPASPDRLDNGEPHKCRLFNCNAERSRIAGPDSQRRAAQAPPILRYRRPVPHRRTNSPGSSSCVATSCLSTLWRAIAVSAAEPAALHRGSGVFSTCRTAAAMSASRSGRLVQLWHHRLCS